MLKCSSSFYYYFFKLIIIYVYCSLDSVFSPVFQLCIGGSPVVKVGFTAVVYLLWHRPGACGLSNGISCSMACEIFQDQAQPLFLQSRWILNYCAAAKSLSVAVLTCGRITDTRESTRPSISGFSRLEHWSGHTISPIWKWKVSEASASRPLRSNLWIAAYQVPPLRIFQGRNTGRVWVAEPFTHFEPLGFFSYFLFQFLALLLVPNL